MSEGLFNVAYHDGEVLSHRNKNEHLNVKYIGKIPPIGSIILYNEILKWQERRMAVPYRGCGIVSSETKNLVLIDKAISPGCFIKTSYTKTEFQLGFVEYVILKSLVYKKDVTYKDMDLNKLSDKIKPLVINY